MSGSTPGPWTVEVEADCDDCQADIYVCHSGTVCDVTVVCTMGQAASVSPDQKIANARLISAAPDLLAALIRVTPSRYLGDEQTPQFQHFEIARAAIARATGQ